MATHPDSNPAQFAGSRQELPSINAPGAQVEPFSPLCLPAHPLEHRTLSGHEPTPSSDGLTAAFLLSMLALVALLSWYCVAIVGDGHRFTSVALVFAAAGVGLLGIRTRWATLIAFATFTVQVWHIVLVCLF